MEVIKRDITSYRKEEILQSVLTAACDLGYPVAFWRLPQSQELHLIVSYDGISKTDNLDLELSGSGFTFSPFNAKKDSLFINADFHCRIIREEVELFQTSPKTESKWSNDLFASRLFQNLEERQNKETRCHLLTNSGEATKAPDYKLLIVSAIEGIKAGRFQKVVPARKDEIELEKDFDLVQCFLDLSDAYPNAFTSLVSIPDVGTWLGATPEVLLEVEDSKIFRTVALAATQKRDPDRPVSETAWTQKEIEEQAMVSRYIINCFKKIRLREFEEKGPKTVIAGNLLHLKTDYQVDMLETNFNQLGTVMLELLHPTSAVAGMPKEESLEFLEKHEGFDREFFSGFLGPVNIENSTNLFVNLRCMQVFENKAWLYAGAGVTEDSVPEKELIETNLKFNTLLNVINKQA